MTYIEAIENLRIIESLLEKIPKERLKNLMSKFEENRREKQLMLRCMNLNIILTLNSPLFHIFDIFSNLVEEESWGEFATHDLDERLMNGLPSEVVYRNLNIFKEFHNIYLHNHDDDDNFEINYSFNSEISNEIEEVIINLMIDLENYET